MHRSHLRSMIDLFTKTWAKSAPHAGRNLERDFAAAEKIRRFVDDFPNCFDRANEVGHVTGSALVVNHTLSKVLLTHHKKLGIWLQLGGHADGNPKCHEVAMTEALEESGLSDLKFLNYEEQLFGSAYKSQCIPFDLDTHLIPKSSKDPEHWHFDVRFIIVANELEEPLISEESHDVRWFDLNQARLVTQEDSMERQFKKVELIRKVLI